MSDGFFYSKYISFLFVLDYCAQLHRLTPGELTVITDLACGKTQAEIAQTRRLSPKTISTQKRNAFRKMQVRSDVDFIHYLHLLKSRLTRPSLSEGAFTQSGARSADMHMSRKRQCP